MWIILFLIVGFVVWHFIPQRDPNKPAPNFRVEPRVVASDPRWPTFVEEHCESPAETAFLRAMIKAYDLRPEGGSLAGGGIRLDFQVEEGCYRTDFLANRWLVIEIDGAAYHSSDEAIARDKVRDEYFESLGYSVVRIPAKVVFNTPGEAVQRVRSALRLGKRTLPTPVQKSGWRRLSDTMTAISDGLDEMNKTVRKSRAVQLGLAEAKTAFDTEKSVIENAVESAKSKLETADWLMSQDQQTVEIYEQTRADISKALAERRSARQVRASETIAVQTFPARPVLSDDAEHNVAIEAGYAAIVEARQSFLEAQSQIIAGSPRLFELVPEELRKLGCPEYWALLCHQDALDELRALNRFALLSGRAPRKDAAVLPK